MESKKAKLGQDNLSNSVRIILTHYTYNTFHRQLTNIPLNWYKNGEQTPNLAIFFLPIISIVHSCR